MKERYSISVLEAAADIQRKKGSDYQSEVSVIKQADYYINGVNSILDVINAKVLRMRSILAKMEAGQTVNFEGLGDSALDSVNYNSFLIAYLAGEIDGQIAGRDIFNRAVTDATPISSIPIKFRPNDEF